MAEGMHRTHNNLPECSRWQPMAQEDTRMTRKGGERVMRRSMRKQHYNSTPQKEPAMIVHISRMLKSLPNILAITGGVSSRQKEGNEKTQIGTRQQHGTLSNDSLATSMFSSVQNCYVVPRIRIQKNRRGPSRTFSHFASYRRAHKSPSGWQLLANLSRAEGNRWQQKKQRAAESRTENVNTPKCLGQSEGNTPQGHTEGREWRAEGKGHALGTWQIARMQQMATDNTRGHRNTPDV